MNKLKIYLFLLASVFIVVFYLSCSDTQTVFPPYKNDFTEISGKAENWTLGVQKLRAVITYSSEPYSYIMDKTTINQDGSFKVSLKELSDNFLSPVDFSTGTDCLGYIDYTPGTKWADLYLEICNSSDSSIGILYYSNFPDTAFSGLVETDFVYMNKDAHISGTRTCSYHWGDTVTSDYSITGSKGWNKIFCYWQSYSPSKSKISFTGYMYSDCKWYYYNWDNRDNIKFRIKKINSFSHLILKTY